MDEQLFERLFSSMNQMNGLIEEDHNLEGRSLDTISMDLLSGLGVPCTEANKQYLILKLLDLIDYIVEISVLVLVKNDVPGKTGSIDPDRDTIEL